MDKYDDAHSFAGGILYAVSMIEEWRDTAATIAGNADKVQALEALRQNLAGAAAVVASWSA